MIYRGPKPSRQWWSSSMQPSLNMVHRIWLNHLIYPIDSYGSKVTLSRAKQITAKMRQQQIISLRWSTATSLIIKPHKRRLDKLRCYYFIEITYRNTMRELLKQQSIVSNPMQRASYLHKQRIKKKTRKSAIRECLKPCARKPSFEAWPSHHIIEPYHI